MRLENIEVTFKMPVKEIDGNGNRYPEDVIKKACEEANGKELIIDFLGSKEDYIIGEATSILYDADEKCIIAKGIINHGGTCEKVNASFENETIESMKILSVGISL